jgi:hypothetical protein
MKIVKNRLFKMRVKAHLPDETGEGTEEHSFVGHFTALNSDELSEHRLATLADQEAFLSRVFAGWEGLTDGRDGEEDSVFAVTDANREFLIKDVFVRPALIQAYQLGLSGAKRGN